MYVLDSGNSGNGLVSADNGKTWSVTSITTNSNGYVTSGGYYAPKDTSNVLHVYEGSNVSIKDLLSNTVVKIGTINSFFNPAPLPLTIAGSGGVAFYDNINPKFVRDNTVSQLILESNDTEYAYFIHDNSFKYTNQIGIYFETSGVNNAAIKLERANGQNLRVVISTDTIQLRTGVLNIGSNVFSQSLQIPQNVTFRDIESNFA